MCWTYVRYCGTPLGKASLRPCSDAQSGLLASTSDESEALTKWELEKGADWAQSLSTGY